MRAILFVAVLSLILTFGQAKITKNVIDEVHKMDAAKAVEEIKTAEKNLRVAEHHLEKATHPDSEMPIEVDETSLEAETLLDEDDISTEEDETQANAEPECIPYPDIELKTICWDVQEWVHAHSTSKQFNCDDVGALTQAKSLMKSDECCNLDFVEPSAHSSPISLIQTSSRRLKEKLERAKASVAVKGSSIKRDEFIARLEAVMECAVPLGNYCPPPKHCKHCDRRADGSRLNEFPKLHEQGQAHEGYWKKGDPTIAQINAANGDGVNTPCNRPDCNPVQDKDAILDITDVAKIKLDAECNELVCKKNCDKRFEVSEKPCRWLLADAIVNRDRCVDAEPVQEITSPCSDIENCDICEDAGVCIWNEEIMTCQVRPVAVKMVPPQPAATPVVTTPAATPVVTTPAAQSNSVTTPPKDENSEKEATPTATKDEDNANEDDTKKTDDKDTKEEIEDTEEAAKKEVEKEETADKEDETPEAQPEPTKPAAEQDSRIAPPPEGRK